MLPRLDQLFPDLATAPRGYTALSNAWQTVTTTFAHQVDHDVTTVLPTLLDIMPHMGTMQGGTHVDEHGLAFTLTTPFPGSELFNLDQAYAAVGPAIVGSS